MAPLGDVLARGDVTDIYINRPGEIWVETLGGTVERHAAPALDAAMLDRLARQVAAFTHQGISREHPLLSATLPDGARIQVIAPPATRGPLALAIRKHLALDLSLADFVATDAFAATALGHLGDHTDQDDELERLLSGGDVAGTLAAAVRGRRNVLISGGTSTGKTTFLNTLINEIPAHERLIFIEDTPELRIAHDNAVGLLAVRGALGEADVGADALLTASLRMRPDRIIVGELRGNEAYTFLRAINTGHPGSMTTVHADSAARAIDQIALLVLQGGSTLRFEDIREYVRSTIDVFVQLERSGGRRRIVDIHLGKR